MNKILVNPDIHGRSFWKKSCEHIEEYDRVIFWGDYLDPYSFEYISVESAISNFEDIIDLKRNNTDKVVLLLGNHDMPYYSDVYFHFSGWHSRHSSMFHEQIKEMFNANKDLFKIAHVEKDVIFTHAGIESGWLRKIVKCDSSDIHEICEVINKLTEDVSGLSKLFTVSLSRGGHDKHASCIWSDVNDMEWSLKSEGYDDKEFHDMKQIFGHTIQTHMGLKNNVEFGKAIEFANCKMIDTAQSYVLDTDSFIINPIEK